MSNKIFRLNFNYTETKEGCLERYGRMIVRLYKGTEHQSTLISKQPTPFYDLIFSSLLIKEATQRK